MGSVVLHSWGDVLPLSALQQSLTVKAVMSSSLGPTR